MFRGKPGQQAEEVHELPQPEQPAQRAPAVREKLECALGALVELEEQVAEYALDAAERKPGAADKLSGHRAKIAAAQTAADELRSALRLAEKLDRKNQVAAATRMRSEQLEVFTKEMTEREKAMDVVLKAGAEMAAAYGRYSEATLRVLAAVPVGTAVPMMSIGSEGFGGPAFGTLERLILAEFYRLAPERSDGVGRFVVPFAKPSSEQFRGNAGAIRPGIEELRDADAAIVADISKQIDKLNDEAMRAAGISTDDRKHAA